MTGRFSHPEATAMSQLPVEDSAREARNRLQSFLDCVAYLLAKRCLREQRRGKKESQPQEQPPRGDEDR